MENTARGLHGNLQTTLLVCCFVPFPNFVKHRRSCISLFFKVQLVFLVVTVWGEVGLSVLHQHRQQFVIMAAIPQPCNQRAHGQKQ